MTRRAATLLAAAAITLPATLTTALILWAAHAGNLGTWIP